MITRIQKRQNGASLIELLIGLALSLIVTSSMVALMANSLGSATRIIQMTQLTDELRNSMSMLTRDVRRANYNPYSLYCYANSDCGLSPDTSVTRSEDLAAVSYNGRDCLRFYLERTDPDGTPGEPVSGGAFRHVRPGDAGWLEMWVGGDNVAPDASCGGGSELWVPVTDSNFVDIETFDVEVVTLDNELTQEGGGTLTQKTRLIQVTIGGELLLDRDIKREIVDTVRVRNDFLELTSL
jgi:type II secretory pathway pseudopilin PulG